MRTAVASPTTRLLVLGALAAGWLSGLAMHWQSWERTGYGDISQTLIALGAGLCFAAGAAARWLLPTRSLRAGAVAGMVMIGTIMVGNVVLGLVMAARGVVGPDVGDETLLSLLLESWFWIGLPLVVSAVLGTLGWLAAEVGSRLGRSTPMTR
jgi:hypothetical protein